MWILCIPVHITLTYVKKFLLDNQWADDEVNSFAKLFNKLKRIIDCLLIANLFVGKFETEEHFGIFVFLMQVDTFWILATESKLSIHSIYGCKEKIIANDCFPWNFGNKK